MAKVIEEKNLIKEVEDKLDQVDQLANTMQWYLNIAYYVGQQYLAYDKTTKKLYEPPKDPTDIRLVANRISPIIRTELAKITKNKPIMTVIPASSEDEDINAAKIGEKIMEYLEYELDLQAKDRELIRWGLTCGTGFVKPYWKDSKGQKVKHPETGEVFRTGDVEIDVVSPFELKFDQSANSWSDVNWVCHIKVRTVDYVKEVYGKEVQPESGLISTNIYEAQLKNVNTNWSTNSYKPIDNSVQVKEYWEKPCTKYPKGRRITLANGVLLYYEEDIGFGRKDDDDRELPFFPFHHINIPGRVYGQSMIEHLIPIQREYNKSRSQIIKNKNLIANPQWLVEDGAVVEEITNSPGGIINYRKGFSPPILSQPASIGADVYKNIDQCIEEFYFISGQNEVSHGAAPTGVKSGVAIAYLQEQDDTKLGPTIQNYIDCKRNYMQYLLRLIRYKYDIPRTIRIVGKNNKVEVIDFVGSQLSSTDVRLQEGSMFQQSRAAKQEFIMQLVQMGVLNTQTDKQQILQMFELGTIDSLYDDYSEDVNQSESENERFKKGDTSPIVRDFFNHQIHIFEHNKFRKSDEYEQLPPELQQIIDQHVAQHEQYLQPQQPMPMEQPQQPQEPSMEDLVAGLSPEEQQHLSENPQIMEEFVNNR